MKQRIPCLCDNYFTVDLPQEINLDTESWYIEAILDGSFMNFICPSCGKLHKPEFAIRFLWPSRNIQLESIPELDRGEFIRRESKKNPLDFFSREKKKRGAAGHEDAEKTGMGVETVIGYPELLDRIAVLRDGLDSTAIEALKYFLLLRAEDSRLEDSPLPGSGAPPRNEPPPGNGESRVWYQGKRPAPDSGGTGEMLEFHLEGLRAGETAVSLIPLSLYEKALEESRGGKKNDLYSGLRVGTYISARNMFPSVPSWPGGSGFAGGDTNVS
jgi:hypothetical protein